MSYRLEKFAGTMQQALGDILSRESLNPGLRRVSVVAVRPARDLKRATVIVACPAGAEKAALEQLAGAAGFIKKQLGRRMILRHMPELEFVIDTAADLELRLRLLGAPGASPAGAAPGLPGQGKP